MKHSSSLPKQNSTKSTPESAVSLFIPNLCTPQSLLFLLILTQLLTLIFSMLQEPEIYINWEFLGLSSMLSHCIVLSCALTLCLSRPFLGGKSRFIIGAYCFMVIFGISVLYSLLASRFAPLPSLITEPNIFVAKVTSISTILGALILRYFFLLDQWRMQKQAELSSRLEALQARIRPHFLFNSMNTIASLIATDPERAEDAVLDLSELFRATLKTQEMMIPLEQEMALCRRYLNIEQLRLGKRLEVEWNIGQLDSSIKIPPLTLQPLVENAIYHGIQPRTEGGKVSIESYRRKKTAYVLITNPVNNTPDKQKHQGNQIAMENIQSRLSAIFNNEALLKTSQRDGIFTATLRFPVSE